MAYGTQSIISREMTNRNKEPAVFLRIKTLKYGTYLLLFKKQHGTDVNDIVKTDGEWIKF